MEKLNIFAIVLAAGASSRMGTSKMALKWGESTVLETTLTNIKNSNVNGLLLVTGGYHNLVESLPKVKEVDSIHNGNYAAGEMISSIKVALSWLKANRHRPDGVLILPGDMPLVNSNLLNLVSTEWNQDHQKITAPVYKNQRGHPVIFPYEIFERFETLPADSSPRDLIKVYSERTHFIPIDDASVIIDVDTPAEYQKYKP